MSMNENQAMCLRISTNITYRDHRQYECHSIVIMKIKIKLIKNVNWMPTTLVEE
jgi:hypothetical protein